DCDALQLDLLPQSDHAAVDELSGPQRHRAVDDALLPLEVHQIALSLVASQHPALDDLTERELVEQQGIPGKHQGFAASGDHRRGNEKGIDLHRLTSPKALRLTLLGTSAMEMTDRCGSTRSVIRRRCRRSSGAHSSTGIRLLFIIRSTCVAIRASICSAKRGSSTRVLLLSTARMLLDRVCSIDGSSVSTQSSPALLASDWQIAVPTRCRTVSVSCSASLV